MSNSPRHDLNAMQPLGIETPPPIPSKAPLPRYTALGLFPKRDKCAVSLPQASPGATGSRRPKAERLSLAKFGKDQSAKGDLGTFGSAIALGWWVVVADVVADADAAVDVVVACFIPEAGVVPVGVEV